MRSVHIYLAFILAITVLTASGKVYELGPNFSMEGQTDGTDVTITVTFPNGYWLSLGFGGATMFNTNMVTFEYMYEMATATDMWSVGYRYPLWVENMWTVVSTEFPGDDLVRMTAKRKLVSNLPQHYSFPLNEEIDFIWAYNKGFFGYHGPNRFMSTLFLDKSEGVLVGEVASGPSGFWRYHGIFLYASWGLLSFCLVISNRHMRHLPYSNLFHIGAGLIIVAMTLVFGVLAILTTEHNFLHTSFGWVTIFACLAQASLGAVTYFFRRISTWRTRTMLYVKLTHRLLGWGLLVLTNINIVLGLQFTESRFRNVIYVQYAMLIFVLCFLETVYRFRGKLTRLEIDLQQRKMYTMSPNEFRLMVLRGKKWALYNEYVVNVEPVLNVHPGGRFLIEKHIGREIGKYLYGSYAVEGNCKPHVHSKFAFQMVERYIVGRVTTPTQYMREDKSGSIEGADEKAVTKWGAKKDLWRVVERSMVHNSVYRIVMQNKWRQVSKFYQGTTYVGFHFVVQSRHNFVCRYYTICNCLGKNFYSRYLEIIRAQEPLPMTDISSFEEDSNVELVIKQYKETQTGISRQVHDDRISGAFQVLGPYGTGLGLSPTSSGMHVVFVGGTGILVFLDLIAYMLRKAIAEDHPDRPMFKGERFDDLAPDFELIMYATFPRRADAIALDLCEGAARITTMKGRQGGFQFIPTYTRERGERLNERSIDRLLGMHARNGQIQRVWACGPPQMNELFERSLERLAPKYGLSKHDYEVL